MSFNFDEPCRRSKTGKKEENDIREIFYEHWEKMKNQTKVALDGINAWRSQTIDEINTHADEQIRQLQTIYSRQRAIFEQKREENISSAKLFQQSKSNSQSNANDTFNEVCNVCRSLEFQVAQLEHIQYQIKRPRVIPIGDQGRGNKQNQSNTHAHGFEDRQARSTINKTNMPEKDRDNNSRSSVQSQSNGTGESFLNTSSPNANNRSTSNSDNSKTAVTDVYDPNNKCPICFMIFPSHMSANDCHQHVNEHIPDGEHGNSTTL